MGGSFMYFPFRPHEGTRSVEPPDVSEDGKSESSPARDDIFSEVHIMQRHNSRTSAMLARKDSRKGKLSRNVTESTVSDAHVS